jgi:hypothetical protein
MDRIAMRKFSIKQDDRPIEPTLDQIQRNQDFSKLYHDYERLTKRGKKPIYRDPKLYLLMVLIGIIALLLFLEV